MKTPRISLVAMESRDPNKTFVKVPNEPGRWILAERCVVEVPCPRCYAAIGEPCFNPDNGKYWVDTHLLRRIEWKKKKKHSDNGQIIIEDIRPRVRVSATIEEKPA